MSAKLDGVDFGPDSDVPMRAIQLQWFDQFLKGKDTPLLSQPPVRIFVMGVEPLARGTRVAAARASATRSIWKAAAAPTPWRAMASFAFARRPIGPARPTGSCSIRKTPCPPRAARSAAIPRCFPGDPCDQRAVEQRRDVLVYATAPLTSDRGSRSVQCAWSCTRPPRARDTDFTAKLVDVFPDGRAQNLTDGILRLRYRESLEKPELARPGEIYKLIDRRRGDRQRVPEGSPHPHRSIQQQLSRASTATRIPAARSPTRPSCARPRKRFTTTRARPSYLLLPVAAGLTSSAPGAVFFSNSPLRRGSQVVRQGSAKPLFVGSIPTRASN